MNKKITSLLKALFLSLMIICLSKGFAQTISSIENNGNLIINNNIVLPIGFYCEGMPFDEYNDIPARMDSGGFNILYTESTQGELVDYPTFLEDCNSRGLNNIIGLPYSFIDPDDFNFYVNELLNYPSIALWNILDDANNFTISDMETQKNNLLALDSTRLTMASWYTDAEPFPSMLPYIELAGMQAYPWEDGSSNDLVFVESLWRLTAIEAQAANKYAIATPQVFNWYNQTYPSAQHIDCQTYIGFITGLKGVLFYTFKDYDNNNTIDVTQPELFNACSKIANEVLNTELKDAILYGEHEYNYINFYRYYATWLYNNNLYLIAVNADDQLTYDYNIDLPDFVVGAGTNMFIDRPDSLSLFNGQLSGQLEPYQVAIYKFETNVLSTTSTTENNKKVKIFPNPGNFIKIESPFESYQLDLFSIDGKGILLTMNSQESGSQIDISNLAQGIYMAKLTDLKTGYYTINRIIKN